jgi:adenine-specific DNA-methyltransferase
MDKRLRLAKQLLSRNGVIFISIGDDEISSLTLLCDAIFGESNRVGTIARLTKSGSNKGLFFAPSKDYILCYKHRSRVGGFSAPATDDYVASFVKKDEKGYYKEVGLYQATSERRPNQRYFIICPDGELVLPPGSSMPKEHKDAAYITPQNPSDKVWRWSYATYLARKSELVFKESKKTPLITAEGKPAKWNVYVKSYLEQRLKDGLRPRDFIDSFPNTQGTKDLADLGLKFPYAKPVNLIKWLLTLVQNNNATVLDFFAGSGTTYQAVTELNAEDNGKRQCIICTNNEGNICKDITWNRVLKVNKTGCTYYRLSIEEADKIEEPCIVGFNGTCMYPPSAYIKFFENFNSVI